MTRGEDLVAHAVRGIRRADRPHEAQGNVASGTKLAEQIKSPEVGEARFMKSGARVYHPTHPQVDKLLERPTYRNNVSVAVDMKGSFYQFLPELAKRPVPYNLTEAHLLLDKIAEGAKSKGNFLPPQTPASQIAVLMKQQARDRALRDQAQKEALMLNEGLSPEEIAALSAETIARINRKHARLTPVETVVALERGLGRNVTAAERVVYNAPSDGAGQAIAIERYAPIPRPTEAQIGMQDPRLAQRPHTAREGEENARGQRGNTGVPSAGFVTATRVSATTDSLLANGSMGITQRGGRVVDLFKPRGASSSSEEEPGRPVTGGGGGGGGGNPAISPYQQQLRRAEGILAELKKYSKTALPTVAAITRDIPRYRRQADFARAEAKAGGQQVTSESEVGRRRTSHLPEGSPRRRR
jgi:hypothetical protein